MGTPERPTRVLAVGTVRPAPRQDEPIDLFRLPTGHTVAVYAAGTLGRLAYADHQVVMLEDTGTRDGNLCAATAAVRAGNP
jgi:hypothetical protein